ncbi:MAG: hypothetical protein AABX71_02665, partial [Nanoarchaeota archaeon]
MKEKLFAGLLVLGIILFLTLAQAAESNVQATVQVSPPFVTINSPIQDNIYNTRRILFNISLQEKVKLLEYINYNTILPKWKTLCSDLKNKGKCPSYTKSVTFREGENNIHVRATSFSGQVYYASVYFRVDSRTPRIRKVFPSKTTNGEFGVMYTELNPVTVTLFYGLNPIPENTKELKCSYGTNIWCNINVDLSSYQGKQIYYSFLVKDYFHQSASKVRKILVDLNAASQAVKVKSDEPLTLQEISEDMYDLLFGNSEG